MRVVCVHGIGQQLEEDQSLLAAWLPALLEGLMSAASPGAIGDGEVGMAFYGDLFLPPGSRLGLGDPMFTAADVLPGLESDLLLQWWAHAAEVDDRVVPPGAETLVRTPAAVQAALRALSRSRFFAGLALRAMVFDLKQVRTYLTDEKVRDAARGRVAALISDDTRVVVAHSLGSVVAYETLALLHQSGRANGVRALVTLGSPLGIKNLIFDRLEPPPRLGVGVWPGGDGVSWTNIVDAGDIVALVKDLRPLFGQLLHHRVVYNGSHAHDVRPYLRDPSAGAAIAAGLA
jgi:hypothetical protein